MKDFFVFGMGFATGWAARTNVDSVRETAVNLIAAGYKGAERLRVTLETEKESLQDLLAEGRAHYEAHRAAKPTPEPEERGPSSEQKRVRAA